ncbi:MAG: methyltransferase domain-containing protein, partial [Acidiferrobacterales bacterium]
VHLSLTCGTMDYASSDVAARYAKGRQLSDSTVTAWLRALSSVVPPHETQVILDVGCGTGRFSGPMAKHFHAVVYALDPSEQMLAKARRLDSDGVIFDRGSAECLPHRDRTIDLVFLSQTYHHLEHRERAMVEFHRVLRPGGHLCIRNSTLDHLDSVPYLRFFPAARHVNEALLPAAVEILTSAESSEFDLIIHRIVNQQHAESLAEYLPRIRQRSLSDLVRIHDAEFYAGLMEMAGAAREDLSQPVTEDIDLFVFRKARPNEKL